MATTNLKIQIQAFVQGMQQLQQLAQGLQQAAQQAGALGNAGAGAAGGLNQAGNAARGASSNFQQATKAGDELIGAMKQLIGPLMAIAGIKISFDYLADAAKYAARTETLGTTLKIVAGNAGYSEKAIQGFEKELKVLGITTQAAREALAGMIQAGIPLEAQAKGSASNVARLARAAQDLAVVTGENSSETLKRMVVNIQQMDTMGLRFMGLTVNMEAAQAKYAQSLGVSTSALTQQQKIMAVNNAVLAEAAKMQGAYEASMETVGKKVASLSRYQQELSEAIGQKLLPAYAAVVDSATGLLKTLEQLASSSDTSKESAEALGEAVGGMANAFSDAVVMVAKFVSENLSMITSISANIIGIGKDVINFATSMVGAAESAGVFKAALWGVGLAVAGLRDGLQLVAAALHGFAAVFSDVVSTVLRGYGELAKAAGFDGIAEGLLNAANSMKQFADKSYESSSQIVKNFAEGRTATQSFLDGVNQLGPALSDFGKATNFGQVAAEIQLLDKATKEGSLSATDLAEAGKRTAADILALGKSGKLAEQDVKTLIEAAKEAGVVLPESFNSAEKAMKAIQEESADVAKMMGEIGKNISFDALLADLQKVSEAQRAGALSSAQASRAFDILEGSVAKLETTTKLTATQLMQLKGPLSTLGKTISDEFDKALTDTGTSLGELQRGVDDKFGLISKSLKVFAENARSSAEIFSQAFSKDIDTAKTTRQVVELADSIALVNARGKQLKEIGQDAKAVEFFKAAAEAANMAKVKFEEVFTASLGAAKTAAEFQRLRDDVKKFGEQTGQTSGWVKAHMDEIGVAATNAAQKVRDAGINDALKKIGLSAEEMRGQTSNAVEAVAIALQKLRAEASVTADEYYRAFSKGLDTAKSLADIQAFRTELNKALQEGKVGWSEYSSGLERVNIKFDELFEKALKAAKTKEDFAQLSQQVQNAGLSAAQTARYMDKIKEAASGAREEVQRMAQQQTEAAAATTRAVQAQVDATKASLAVQQSKNDLVKAEMTAREAATRAAQLGTEESRKSAEAARQEVEVAKINVQLQEERARLAQLRVQQEAAGYDLLIAKQRLLNAEKEKERNPGNAAAQAAVEAAQREVEAKQLVVEQTKQAVEAQQQNVARTEEAAAKAQQLANNMRSAADEAKRAADNAAKSRDWVRDASGNVMQVGALTMDNVVKQFQDIGYSLQEANNQASQLMRGQKMIVAYGFEGVAAYQRITEAIKEAEKAKEADAQAAKDVTENYNRIKNEIEDAQLGIQNNERAMKGWGGAASQVSEAYRQIQRDAASALQSADQAARSFSKSMSSIHEELLNAQGREEEASASRFATRRNELKVEYEILQVNIQTAIAKAKAAGVSTAGLEESARAAAAAYGQAQSDLNALEKIEIDKIKKKKAEEEQARKEKAAKEAEDAARKKQEDAQRAADDVQRQKEAEASKAARDADAKKSRSEIDAIDAANRLADVRRQGALDELEYSNEVVSLRNRAAEEEARAQESLISSREQAEARRLENIRQGQIDQLRFEQQRQELAKAALGAATFSQTSNTFVQSIAQQATGGPKSSGEFITVKFTNERGQESTALVPEAQKDDFLDMLTAARNIS